MMNKRIEHHINKRKDSSFTTYYYFIPPESLFGLGMTGYTTNEFLFNLYLERMYETIMNCSEEGDEEPVTGTIEARNEEEFKSIIKEKYGVKLLNDNKIQANTSYDDKEEFIYTDEELYSGMSEYIMDSFDRCLEEMTNEVSILTLLSRYFKDGSALLEFMDFLRTQYLSMLTLLQTTYDQEEIDYKVRLIGQNIHYDTDGIYWMGCLMDQVKLINRFMF